MWLDTEELELLEKSIGYKLPADTDPLRLLQIIGIALAELGNINKEDEIRILNF